MFSIFNHRSLCKPRGHPFMRTPSKASFLRAAFSLRRRSSSLTSSNAFGASSSSCGHGLAGSSAASAARLMAMRRWKIASARCGLAQQVRSQDQQQRGPKVYACMPGSNASAKVKPARLTMLQGPQTGAEVAPCCQDEPDRPQREPLGSLSCAVDRRLGGTDSAVMGRAAGGET
jgi:hypothetical protein